MRRRGVCVRIGVTGSRGQLGTEIVRVLSRRHEVIRLERPAYDVADLGVADAIARLDCDLVVHAAAMTNVDGCARDPDAAFVVNALGTRNVALGCQRSGAALLVVSSNEVFDGRKPEPYWEFDRPNPINPYGASKLAAEELARSLVARTYIVRAAWIFGPAGDNFVTKMLRLAAQMPRLRLVTDEVSTPTYAPDLAEAIARLIETGAYGIYHFTNAGQCSRFAYAARLFELTGRQVDLETIALKDFVRASAPPPFTPLRNFAGARLGIALRPWEDALAEYLRLHVRCSRPL